MRGMLRSLAILALVGCGNAHSGGLNGGDDSPAPVIDGSLDETFGAGGITSTDLGGEEWLYAVVVLANGSILSGGYADAGGLLARYAATGALDTSFGELGRRVTVIPGSAGVVFEDIGLQSDGKIVVAGRAYMGTTEFLAGRFLASGELDTTFGEGGFAVVDFFGDDDLAHCAIVLDDDRILLGGFANNGVDDDFALVRLTSNGTLDASFGTSGKVSVDFGHGNDSILGLALDGGSRIVAAGYAAAGTGTRAWGLARFTTEGTIDASFGTEGRVVLASEVIAVAYGVTILPDDEIVFTGGWHGGERLRMAVARLRSSGELVSSFGVNGIALVDFGSDESFGYTMLPQANGGLLIAGYAKTGTVRTAAIARVDAAGALDPTFDRDGKRTFVLGTGGLDELRDLAEQPDGKIIAAGRSRNADFDTVLVRFDI